MEKKQNQEPFYGNVTTFLSCLFGKLHRNIKIMQHCSSEKLAGPGVGHKKIQHRTCDPRSGLHLDQSNCFPLPLDTSPLEITIAMNSSIFPLRGNH